MIAIALVAWMAAGAAQATVANDTQPGIAEATAAAEKAFGKMELEKFLRDFPGFIEKVRQAGRQEALSSMVRRPETLASEPAIQAAAKEAGWEPPRFIYVLRHVTFAAKALLTGGMGDERLAMLRRRRDEAAQAQDQELVQELERALVEHEESVNATHAIPKSELLLMQRRKAELKMVLEKTLQLRPRVAPAH
jgi:hypothetical protein